MVFNEKERPLKSSMEGSKNSVNESYDNTQLGVEFGNDTTGSHCLKIKLGFLLINQRIKS